MRLSLSGGGLLAQLLLWAGVAIAAAVLLAAILRHLDGERAARAVKAAAVERRHQAPAAVAAAELPDFERLAAAGNFAAAVHALLAHAIFAWTRGGGEAPLHATARDVLRRVRAVRRTPAVVEQFAQLVGSVERVHFGGAAADRGVFEASREHLRQWESACPLRP